MKKILALLLSFCFVLGFAAGCSDGEKDPGGNGNTPVDPLPGGDEEELLSVEEILEKAEADDLTCPSYEADKYLLPIWESQIVYNETVCFIQNEDGTYPVEQLAYPVAKVLEVRDSTLGTLYEEGKDYEIAEGGIRLLADTSVTHFAFDEFYLKEAPSSTAAVESVKHPGRYLKLGDGGYFYSRQVCVTYIRTEKYTGPQVRDDSKFIPETIAKLQNKEDLSIVFYGDSITTGSSVSGWQFANIEPYTPIFSDMIVTELERFYGYDGVESHNTAVGGWTAAGAKTSENVTDRVIAYSPDLVVLAFGMNDAGGAINPDFRQTFQTNIETIITYTRRFLPACEFLLVSTMLPNPDGKGNLANHRDCKQALENLVNEYEGVALADMTSMSDWLLERKEFQDMGDNLVHPTDFLSRIYAQVILNSLLVSD